MKMKMLILDSANEVVDFGYSGCEIDKKKYLLAKQHQF
jgi:hypothetical protein